MSKKQVYLDNAATTKMDEEVEKIVNIYNLNKYANPSSSHSFGQEAREAFEKARSIIAKSINSKTREIFFTSGGTESNNWVLKGLYFQNEKESPGKNHIITTKIEHDSILSTCKWLETRGAKITYLDVNGEGFIDLEGLEKAITDQTFLVSIIHGNNEIGTIQDLEGIGKICKEHGVLFHTDACQSFTKTLIDVRKQNIDLVTLNSHKIHGPKGVGALYVKEGIKIVPLMHGGGHERGMRSGTENVPGVAGFGKAVEISNSKYVKQMTEIRDYAIERILNIPKEIGYGNKVEFKLNGPKENRLCNNINISFRVIEGEAIGGYLENEGISTSTGSACASHSLKSSHVLEAIGVNPADANSSLRMSISKYTTKDDINYFLEHLKPIVKKLIVMSPLI